MSERHKVSSWGGNSGGVPRLEVAVAATVPLLPKVTKRAAPALNYHQPPFHHRVRSFFVSILSFCPLLCPEKYTMAMGSVMYLGCWFWGGNGSCSMWVLTINTMTVLEVCYKPSEQAKLRFFQVSLSVCTDLSKTMANGQWRIQDCHLGSVWLRNRVTVAALSPCTAIHGAGERVLCVAAPNGWGLSWVNVHFAELRPVTQKSDRFSYIDACL